jgi:hypothetical protein
MFSANLEDGITTIDVSQWARGMYFAEIIKEGTKEMKKFVLQ